MSKLCCVVIPSRKRVDGLLKAIKSFQAFEDAEDLEIRVRFDRDDEESIDRLKEVEELGAKILIGDRMLGYNSIGTFCSEMAAATEAPWIWLADDDSWVEGRGFSETLRATPLSGVVMFPEIYQLNNCQYTDFLQSPIIPNKSWGDRDIGPPPDAWLYAELVTGKGWEVRHLPGVIFHHDWRGNERGL
jgi:hypothetical protein